MTSLGSGDAWSEAGAIRWLRLATTRLMDPGARRSTALLVRYQNSCIGAKGAVNTQGRQQQIVVGERLLYC